MLQAVAILEVGIEYFLELRRGQAMSCSPGRTGRLVPDGSVAWCPGDRVPVDETQAVAIANETIELVLVVGSA